MLVFLLASAVFGVKLQWVNLFSGKNLDGWRIYVNG
jgi:hypothetical protein